MSKNSPARKRNVHVPQHLLHHYLLEVGPQDVTEVALIADISVATARRQLDGLVTQGKCTLDHPHTGAPWIYTAVDRRS